MSKSAVAVNPKLNSRKISQPCDIFFTKLAGIFRSCDIRHFQCRNLVARFFVKSRKVPYQRKWTKCRKVGFWLQTYIQPNVKYHNRNHPKYNNNHEIIKINKINIFVWYYYSINTIKIISYFSFYEHTP